MMPGRGTQVTLKEEVVCQDKRYCGFFALITGETMDAVTALEVYRNKGVVKKAFGNLKERLSMQHARVSSEQSLDGKSLVRFVAQICLSCIKKQIQVKGLFKGYTLPGLLDRLDFIECSEYPGRALRAGEVRDAQARLYCGPGIGPPASL